jgi:hypothetical protein
VLHPLRPLCPLRPLRPLRPLHPLRPRCAPAARRRAVCSPRCLWAQSQFLAGDEIPDELLPYVEKLSPRFFEVRTKIIKFIKDVIQPATPVYKQQWQELKDSGLYSHDVYVPLPPIMKELREKAKAAGLYNFFLPEVGRMTVLEYAPIAEILGAFPLCNGGSRSLRGHTCAGAIRPRAALHSLTPWHPDD